MSKLRPPKSVAVADCGSTNENGSPSRSTLRDSHGVVEAMRRAAEAFACSESPSLPSSSALFAFDGTPVVAVVDENAGEEASTAEPMWVPGAWDVQSDKRRPAEAFVAAACVSKTARRRATAAAPRRSFSSSARSSAASANAAAAAAVAAATWEEEKETAAEDADDPPLLRPAAAAPWPLWKLRLLPLQLLPLVAGGGVTS